MASTDVGRGLRKKDHETDRKRNNINAGKNIVTQVRSGQQQPNLKHNPSNQDVVMTQTSNPYNSFKQTAATTQGNGNSG